MSCRTQGVISRHPSLHPSFRPSPLVDIQDLKLALSTLELALKALNQPPMPRICHPDLKCALQTFNQPSKHQISPPNLKSALQALILPSSPQICLQGPKSAILSLKYAPSGHTEGRTSQNSPLCSTRLPCSHSTSSLDHSQQGIGHR